MLKRKQKYEKTFLTISSTALLFVLAELILQYFGRSLCPTEGCKLVALHVRYGDISILLIGLVTFFFLTLLSFLRLFTTRAGLERYIDFVLIVSLACEGFFTGYQAFSIHTPCIFCLIILGFLVVLGIIRLLAGEREVIAGFASLAAVFGMLYLVLPGEVVVSLPENDQLILFYSKDCKHCTEIMKELEDSKLTVKHLEVNGYSGLLKSMGIEHVPTLLVNDKYQKVFLTGKEAIRRYLLVCAARNTAENPTPNKKSKKTANPTKTIDTELKLDIFTLKPGIFTRPGDTAPGGGLCKEDEICK